MTKNRPRNFQFHPVYHLGSINHPVCPPLPLVLLQLSPKHLEVMHALIQPQDQLEPANASNDEAEHRKREYKIIIMLVRMLVRVIKLKVLDTKQPITLLTTISI